MVDRLSTTDVIEKRGDKYVLLSKNSGEVLGEHDTLEAAQAQERAVEASKEESSDSRERVFRTDTAVITEAHRDPWGFMHVHATVSAPGVFAYVRDGKIRRELKHPDELFSQSHLASIDGAVVTDEHPANREAVTPDNIKTLSAGQANGTPEVTAAQDGILIKLKVTDDSLMHAIEARKKTGVSLGKMMEFDPTPGVWVDKNGAQHAYDGVQRQMVTNHIAITSSGRVPSAQLHLDSQDHELLELENDNMPEQLAPLTIDGATLQVDATTASVVQAAMARHEQKLIDLQEKLDRSVETHDSVVAERDKAIAERDGMKAERDAAVQKLKVADAVDLDALADARVEFREKLQLILPKEDYDSLKGKSDIECMRFACDSLAKDIDVENETDDYVRAWFKITCDSQAKSNDDQFAATLAHASVAPSAVSHRSKLNDRLAAALEKADTAHKRHVEGSVHA